MPRRLAGKIPTVLLIPGVGRESLTDKPGRLDCEAAKYLHTTAQYFHATQCHTLTTQAHFRNTRHSAGRPEKRAAASPLPRRSGARERGRFCEPADPASARRLPGLAASAAWQGRGHILYVHILYVLHTHVHILYVLHTFAVHHGRTAGAAAWRAGGAGLGAPTGRSGCGRSQRGGGRHSTKYFAGAVQRRGWRWAGWQCPAVDDKAVYSSSSEVSLGFVTFRVPSSSPGVSSSSRGLLRVGFHHLP